MPFEFWGASPSALALARRAKLNLLSVRDGFSASTSKFIRSFRRRERSRFLLKNGPWLMDPRALSNAAPLQIVLGQYFIGTVSWTGLNQLGFISSPSFSGVVCPVCNRHQSTPKPRAKATSSCFLRPGDVLGLMI
jgi:hypothetical protein